MLRNLTLKQKLFLSFGIIILVLIFKGFAEYSTLNQLREQSAQMQNLKQINSQVLDIKGDLQSQIRLFRGLHLAQNPDDARKIREAHKENTKTTTQKLNDFKALNLQQSHLKSDTLNAKLNTLIAKSIDQINKEIQESFQQAYTTKSVLIGQNQMQADTSAAPDNLFSATSPTNAQADFDRQIGTGITLCAQLIADFENTANSIDTIFNDLYKKNSKILRSTYAKTAVSILFAFLVAILIASYMVRQFSHPILQMQERLTQLSRGELPDKMPGYGNSEINKIAQKLNKLIENLRKTRNMAIEVGQGNFDTKVKVFKENSHLGKALSEMRESLYKVAAEQEKQKHQESQRNWSNRGLAQFSEILRQNNDDIEKLSELIIKNLVKYLDATQGGLFVINDNAKDEIFIEQVSCFAYDRKKMAQKKIPLKSGLVGRCIDESETIHISEVPDSYLRITSGLGNANPRNILLVPLKVNEEIFGAVELASFNLFEQYHIQFVEKVSENIASTLASVKINARTGELLSQAQEQAEEMAAQEEELRQNLEEMQATQDEADRKEQLAIGFENTVNHTTIRADFDVRGRLTYANSRFLEMFGYMTREVEGDHFTVFHVADRRQDLNDRFLSIAAGGRHFEGEELFQGKNQQFWMFATYTAVRNRDGEVDYVLFLAVNIDKKKRLELKNEKLLKELAERNRELEQQLKEKAEEKK